MRENKIFLIKYLLLFNMQDLDSKIARIKIQLAQYKYKKIISYLIEVENHINKLYNDHMISDYNRNINYDNLYMLGKNINIEYNECVKNNNKDDLYIWLKFLINDIIINENENILNQELLSVSGNHYELLLLDKIFPLINPKLFPLGNIFNKLIEIIKKCGTSNLISLLQILNVKISDNILNELVLELNNIFIPTGFEYIDNFLPNTNYFWKIPKSFEENDLLNLTRELYIVSDKFIVKISGYFINDSLLTINKATQLNFQHLSILKSLIINNIKSNKTVIGEIFCKNYLKYCYIGDIYCVPTDDFINIMVTNYKKFLKWTGLEFINILKEFVSVGANAKTLYEYIFILLLGDDNTIDVASLFIDLLKEKKTYSPTIYKMIMSKLPFNLSIKMKKASSDIKSEIEKIKSIDSSEIDWTKQLALNKHIPEYVKSLTLEKIEEMKTNNNEYYKQLTFVKNIINFPWACNENFLSHIKSNHESTSNYLLDIETKLENLSYGHEEAKKSLLLTIGKWVSNPSSQGTSFGLVGPPGVGKTLLAKSVSKALNIPFAEITLGGQNDGELLYGHGYTYSGSQPGMIVKKMVEMGSPRAILYFDELDKTCSKHGTVNEITSILIHMTDPNMNSTFQDRFFQGVDFPLDKVIMIFSYNDAKLVDPILLDRLKQIEVSAYTISEKIKIVQEFIIPETADNIGLKNEPWIKISDKNIEYLIENYTNEAGVRSIKRVIEQLFLTLNLDKIYNREEFKTGISEINLDIITRILKQPKLDIQKTHEKPEIGIINGLFATNSGTGGILPIQIFDNTNSYEIKLTGNQGAVMKESVSCSLTASIEYLRRIKYFDNVEEYLNVHHKNGFHIHATSTAVPKDGPSAGCAFTSAFISRILKKKISNLIGMTGEIELNGKITKIGGLNFKLIGAKKAGLNTVYIPKENAEDLDNIKEKYPNLINENFKVICVDYIDDLINEILVEPS